MNYNTTYHKNYLMQQRSLKVKCANGHQALKLCTLQTCQQPSPICTSIDCKYSDTHQQCLTNTSVDDIIKMMTKKTTKQAALKDELILGTIDKMMKILDVLKMSYLAASKDCQNRFEGDQKKLYGLLKNGPIENLKPETVYNCIKKLNQKTSTISTIKSNERKQNSEKTLSQFNDIIKQFKQSWIDKQEKEDSSEVVNLDRSNLYKLDSELCNDQFVSLTGQGINAVAIKQLINRCFYSLMTPCISKSNFEPIRLRATKCKGIIYVGVAKKNQMVGSKFRKPENGVGLYVTSSNGFGIHHLDDTLNQKYIGFGFKQGETVEMKYQKEEKKLIIRNIDRSTQHEMNNIDDDAGDLCYCIGLYEVSDTMTIIKEKEG